MTPPPTTPTPKRERLNMGERTPADYAIEHGGYLADAVTAFLKLIGEESVFEEMSDNGLRETVSDYLQAMRSGVYEFKKRADRAARTEGRGEGEPVAWAYEYTNHLKGDRAPGGWLRAVAFEAPTRARVNAGFARNVQPLYASPIREPEISREAVIGLLTGFLVATDDGWPLHDDATPADVADAILNLAPVGGRGEGCSYQSQPGVSAVQQPASSSAQHSAEWRCRRCGRDEVDCRENGCPRGPCPMELVG